MSGKQNQSKYQRKQLKQAEKQARQANLLSLTWRITQFALMLVAQGLHVCAINMNTETLFRSKVTDKVLQAVINTHRPKTVCLQSFDQNITFGMLLEVVVFSRQTMARAKVIPLISQKYHVAILKNSRAGKIQSSTCHDK